MIRFVKGKEIDRAKWDHCIQHATNGQIFVFSWYLDICCPGWDALIEDDYQAVFPLKSGSKAGIAYLFQPFFTRHFGVFSISETTPGDRLRFLAAIPTKYRFWDFCLHAKHQETPPDASTEKRVFQYLPLQNEYAAIRSKYNENLVRNLKKSAKESYRFITDYPSEKVAEQFHLLQKNKLSAFSESDFKLLGALMKTAAKNTSVKSVAVMNKHEEVIAGAFLMESHERMVYLKGFSKEEGKKNGAMHFLFDQLIQQQAGSHKTLDFGGSSVDSVARFYKSFGALDCVYLHLRKNRLPKLLRWIKRK